MGDQPIEIPCASLREWLSGRSTVLRGKGKEDFVWMLDEAVALAQRVRYDMPTVKKGMAKTRKAMGDADRRRGALKAQVAEAQRVFEKRCGEVGVDPAAGDFTVAITATATTALPDLLDSIAERATGLRSALEYFDAVTAVTSPGVFGDDAALPVLRHAVQHGAASRLLPYCGVDAARDGSETPPDADEESIDWGGFGDDADMSEVQQPWQVEIVEEEDEAGDSACAKEGAGKGGGTGHAGPAVDAATRLLACDTTRAAFEDDLVELQALLEVRRREVLAELEGAVGVELPPSCPALGPAQLERHIEEVAGVMAQLQSKALADLLFAAASDSYAARLAAELQQRRHEIALSAARAAANEERCAAAHEALGAAEEELRQLAANAGDSKRRIETLLSKWYAPRPVHLVGGVESI